MIESVQEFYGRSATEVCPQLAERWSVHQVVDTAGKPIINTGKGHLVGLQVGSGVKLYIPRLLEVYSHDYTMERWPNSHGPEIERMQPGEIVAYGFRGVVCIYIKTQGAENIMVKALAGVDYQGKSLAGNEQLLTSSKIAPTLGMRHGDHGQISVHEHAGHQLYLFHQEARVLTDRERVSIEADLLAGVDKI